MNSDALSARIENLLGSSPSGGAEHSPAKPPPPLPDHELIARIGSGSYGEVWLARGVTGAWRAVKVVWRSHFASERPYEREFRGIVQFEPISRSHPGVVNILHVGRDDEAGCFFYVMELADDAAEQRGKEEGPLCPPPPFSPAHYCPRTLASDLKSRARLSVTETVSLGVQLASALGHLHRHGLVHRDVKPSNVIFVHGQSKLADIGLVTSVNEEQSFVGTEGFIPPEGPGSERADLFALGRLLYEAVTGKNRCEFPGLPDDLDHWPKGEREALIELNEVLARACAPEARNRHRNAAELAGDLNLILAGRSVRRAYRVERRLRRATWVSISALALVFATIFSNGLQRRQRKLADTQARRESALREQTQKSLARAEAAERESRQQLYAALLEQARATVLTGERGQRVRALEAVRRAAAISNSAALRGVAVAALSLPDLRFDREVPTTPDLTLVQLDPVFERIAVCRANGPVEIRSVSDRQLLATLPASSSKPAYVGRWSPNGRYFAVSRDYAESRDQTSRIRLKDVEVWEVERTNRVLLLRNSTWDAMSFHPRLPQIMVGHAPDTAVTWDLESGQELTSHQLAGEPIDLRFSPDGERFAAVCKVKTNSTVAIHETANGAARASHHFSARVSECNWHPDGGWLAAADGTGVIHWMDTQTGETHALGQHKSVASHVVFTPDGKYFFSGGWDRELICWDAKTLRRAFTVGLDSYKMQFRADGRQCAIWRWPEVRLQLHTFELPALFRELAGDIGGGRNSASFSPDGRWLAAAGFRHVLVWNANRGEAGTEVTERATTSVSFAPNGDLFAFRLDRVDECSRWRVTGGTNGAAPALEPLPLFNPTGLTYLVPTPDGVVFTTKGGSKLVGYDQLANEQQDWKPTPDGPARISPNGRWLGVYRSGTPYSYALRLPEFEQVAKLTNQAIVNGVEFSPAGGELAVCSRAGVEFWSTTTWQRTRHLTSVTDLLYSRDAGTFWLWTGLRSSGLYDARTAELLLPLPPGTIPLALSIDGRRLAAAVDAHRVQLWDLVEVRGRLRELGLDWADQK